MTANTNATENGMSDSESQTSDLLSKFVDFAVEKKVSVNCPACSSASGWNLFTRNGSHHVIPAGAERDILIGAGGVNVLTMRCRNCGFIRMFDLDLIRQVAADIKRRETGTPEKSESE